MGYVHCDERVLERLGRAGSRRRIIIQQEGDELDGERVDGWHKLMESCPRRADHEVDPG
jgi:hypothetical protein